MNTYETMKHNIPEGATHYCDDSSEFNFAWFNAKKGKVLIDGLWVECTMSAYPAGFIKPIPQPTYRYEKVTDSIFDLKEEFERGELFSFDGNEHYVQIETEGDFSYAHIYENLYRRIEVTERELEIEAAYDLYCEWWGDGHHKSFNEFKGEQMTATRECWLRVVRKAEYKLVNGKG